MKSFRACAIFALLCLSGLAQAESLAPGETSIAIVRHGEKPKAGLGMLTCQGLNRSLALPAKLAALAGKPDVALAPNPSERKNDQGVEYDYNRPLLTIAPSAIAAGIPISVEIGWKDHKALAQTHDSDAMAGKTVYVAWEHHLALVAMRDLFALEGADASVLPAAWDDADFDSVMLIRLGAKDAAGKRSVSFRQAAQGLNGALAMACPL